MKYANKSACISEYKRCEDDMSVCVCVCMCVCVMCVCVCGSCEAGSAKQRD